MVAAFTHMVAAFVLSLVAVAYNNLINWWSPFQRWAYVPTNLAFAAGATVVTARSFDLSGARLGLQGDVRDAALPLLLTVCLAIAAFLVTRSPQVKLPADRRVAGLRGGPLAYYVLIRIPLGTAVAEEVLFRGALFALWRDVGSSVLFAAVASSLAFGLWHIAPTVIGLRINEISVSTDKVLGAIVLTTVVGLVLTWLRVATGGLLVPIAVHGAVNSIAALTAALAASSEDAESRLRPLGS